MKRYDIEQEDPRFDSAPMPVEREDGEWVPAGVAQGLYDALEDALSELETMRYARYEALEAKCRAALAEARGE